MLAKRHTCHPPHLSAARLHKSGRTTRARSQIDIRSLLFMKQLLFGPLLTLRRINIKENIIFSQLYWFETLLTVSFQLNSFSKKINIYKVEITPLWVCENIFVCVHACACYLKINFLKLYFFWKCHTWKMSNWM